MRLVFRYVKFILILVYSVSVSGCQAQFVEFETSWERAKKISKKSGKPIIAIFSSSKYTDMNDRYFGVDSIASLLKEDFILYFHIRGNKTPWHISRYSTVIISDHNENKYKDIWYYYFQDNLIEEIRSYDQPRPLSYYEKKYEKDKNSLSFLEEYVEYALKYRLQKTTVFYDYFRRIEGFNCLKVLCVTQHLYFTLPTDELLSYYEEMSSLSCDNNDIKDRIFSSFHRDFLFRYGREPEESRYSDYQEAANKTTEFLGETIRYRDSLIDYNSWKFHRIEKYNRYTKEKAQKVNALLLKVFDYKIENIYSQDSLQSLLFDLSISIDNRSGLEQLAAIILNRPHFINNAAIVEILAIVYYRLGNNERSNNMILRVDRIALKNGVNYYSILPEMKEKGLLKKVEK